MPFSRSRFRGKAAGYRSGLEESVGAQLKAAGIDPQYEAKENVIRYTKPETEHRYTPDFKLPSGIIIETKGRFLADDRKKHLLIKQQHPSLDIRFVFYRAKTPITGGSKTTLAMWAEKNGFKWAEKLIPEAWLKEKRK